MFLLYFMNLWELCLLFIHTRRLFAHAHIMKFWKSQMANAKWRVRRKRPKVLNLTIWKGKKGLLEKNITEAVSIDFYPLHISVLLTYFTFVDMDSRTSLAPWVLINVLIYGVCMNVSISLSLFFLFSPLFLEAINTNNAQKKDDKLQSGGTGGHRANVPHHSLVPTHYSNKSISGMPRYRLCRGICPEKLWDNL